MFNENKFRSIIALKGITIAEVAEKLGISKVTLYRKMSGESDFYREEIQRLRSMLDIKDLDEIFFAQKVS